MNDYDEFDDFDDADEIDDGFIVSDGDYESAEWYSEFPAIPYCDLGYGDDAGFCVKAQFGCHLEGCSHADHD